MKRLPEPRDTDEPLDPLDAALDPGPEAGQAARAAEPAGEAHGVRRARPSWRGQAPVIGVVALGGAVGACARYGASVLWPTPAGGFPWTTLWVNVIGCAVIGVFLVVVTEVWAAHRLVRPFFGTGVLGGFTTFSTYAVDIQRLLDTGRTATGLAYLGLTLVAALAAVGTTAALTRRALAWRTR